MGAGEGLTIELRGRAQTLVLELELAQADEVLQRSDELVVVPRLLHVVDRALANEGDGRLERGPRRHEEDRHRREDRPDAAEELDPLLARCRVATEIHVLHDGRDPALPDARERLLGAGDALGAQAVDLEQELERLAHRLLVVDDEHSRHAARSFLHNARTCREVHVTPPRLSRMTNHIVIV